MSIPVLTIDGPSGAGKGTVSRALAKLLNWHYLDSGAIYRCLAIALLQANVKLDEVDNIVHIAQIMDLDFVYEDTWHVLLNGADVGAQLVTESTGHAASVIAVYPEVRKVLLQKQKDFKKHPGLVADGRDMGSVVFPEAQFKVYLTASAEERASRRYKQLKEKGIDANLLQITQEIEARDMRDKARVSAPLMVPEGAYYIDSSALTISQVIEQVMNLVS